MKHEQMIYVGTITSDRMHSLKYYDSQVVDAFKKANYATRDLRDEISKEQCLGFFSKLKIKQVTYPQIVSEATRSASFMHIGNECYSYLGKYSHCPVSITCHDLAELEYSEQSPLRYKLWKTRMKWLPNADHIFCISKYTLEDVVRNFGVDRSRLSVNYNGFIPLDKISVEQLSGLSKQLQKDKGSSYYIFHPGVVHWRKNIPRLLESIAKLRARDIDARLIKVGGKVGTVHADLIAKLSLEGAVIDLGRVPLRQLNELYSICDVLAFPSVHEGFGLPVLEAQSCGLPTVLARSTALPEVGGEAALYHAVKDVSEMTDRYQEVYEDRSLREGMILRGYENIKRFSWAKHVDSIQEHWGS